MKAPQMPRLLPATPEGRALFAGVVLVSVGFLVAELLHSILYAPLALVVPGALLIVFVLLPSRPEADE